LLYPKRPAILVQGGIQVSAEGLDWLYPSHHLRGVGRTSVERAIPTPCKGQGGWSVAPCWILIMVSSGPVVHPLLYLFAFTSRFMSRSLVFVFGCLLGSAPPRSLFRGTLYHSRSLEPIGPSKTDNDEVPHRLGGSFGPRHCPRPRHIDSRSRQRAGRRS